MGMFPAQAICPLWGAKLARFCSQYQVREDFWVQSHIGKRSAPPMPYKPLERQHGVPLTHIACVGNVPTHVLMKSHIK